MTGGVAAFFFDHLDFSGILCGGGGGGFLRSWPLTISVWIPYDLDERRLAAEAVAVEAAAHRRSLRASWQLPGTCGSSTTLRSQHLKKEEMMVSAPLGLQLVARFNEAVLQT